MKTIRFGQILFVALTCLDASIVLAVEPWADRSLPVTEGLMLWLDASAESRARGVPEVTETESSPLEVWHDASGYRRDAVQADPESRPHWGTAEPAKMVSFDGQKQHFVVASSGLQLSEATVVVFARAYSNAGDFRAFLSANKTLVNDYVSGFNIDLGYNASVSGLGALNVEGPGFGGMDNLLRERVVLGAPFPLVTRFEADQVRAGISEAKAASRPRAKNSVMSTDQFVIGARTYDNSGKAPTPRGFFHGEMFELLIYDRALTNDEVRAVRGYLASKYAAVVYVTPPRTGKAEGSIPLVAVSNPPLIQPLVPGFTTRKLPFSLPNVNFLRYRADGRLYAGAYDGKIYLLRDTDADGLEDLADIYYESDDLKVVMGMALTPPEYPRGEGVFVATRGQILLILDENSDNKGDKVIVVAKDWEDARVKANGVSDALGVVVADDGTVYFGLGTADFTNAYLYDTDTDVSEYRLASERGTIQKVSPDFSKREAFCTGIRFTVGLAFNAQGDLFASEQEGATWLVNGNPFDELLHIQPGRHYGFPPRHPRHLPDVIDEPSTFDYRPQHQSTVGLMFNLPVSKGGPIFGPEWWRGDALIAAMSRGKIYRTKLVKTETGYVAKNEIFAALQKIIIDQAISPSGNLTVTIHGGAPDWGTGPAGKGELWQIVPLPQRPPQPIIAWSSSPRELQVTFDAAINDSAFAAMQGAIRIVQGRYAQAGDRFETMRPGYKVVNDQLASPRFQVAVQKLSLADDRRTLIITTPDRTASANYTISFECDSFQTRTGDTYSGQIDLLADLTGVDVEWRPTDGSSPIHGWIPHPEWNVAREFTANSEPHRKLFDALARDGEITLHGQLDLGLMLYPAIQEGAMLDWEYPEEDVTVVFNAARPFTFNLGNSSIKSALKNRRHEARQKVKTTAGSWFPYTVTLETGSGNSDFAVHWTTDRSTIPRPFPLRRFLVPYAKQQELSPITNQENLPQIAGANPENGKAVFKDSCAVCHTIRGEGGKVGPNLSNLIYRDYDSVLRDLYQPNAAINPEHAAFTVLTTSGLSHTGLMTTSDDDVVILALPTGKSISIPRADIDEIVQSPISLMPQGYDKIISDVQSRDLMSYLLLPPFESAPIVLEGAPAPRKLVEVQAILGEALTPTVDSHPRKIRIVLCASDKDPAHGRPGAHDYPLWRTRWTRLLGRANGITVEPANDWPTREQWETADVIAFNSYNPAWSLEGSPVNAAGIGAQMDAFLARGGGIVFIHFALNAGQNAGQLASRLGLAWGAGSRFRHGVTDWSLEFSHPLAKGFREWQIPDESYWNLTGDLIATRSQVLATSFEENEPRPQMWTREVGPGRIFVSIPGHYTWTYDDPLFRILIFRGIMWSAHEPIDRLAPLVLIGARVTP